MAEPTITHLEFIDNTIYRGTTKGTPSSKVSPGWLRGTDIMTGNPTVEEANERLNNIAYAVNASAFARTVLWTGRLILCENDGSADGYKWHFALNNTLNDANGQHGNETVSVTVTNPDPGGGTSRPMDKPNVNVVQLD
jgi:hypothetical protein